MKITAESVKYLEIMLYLPRRFFPFHASFIAHQFFHFGKKGVWFVRTVFSIFAQDELYTLSGRRDCKVVLIIKKNRYAKIFAPVLHNR